MKHRFDGSFGSLGNVVSFRISIFEVCPLKKANSQFLQIVFQLDLLYLGWDTEC